MKLQYFAILGREDPETAATVALRGETPDGLYLVSFDHRKKQWTQDPELFKFLYGEEYDRAREISESEAKRIAGSFGSRLPTEQEIEDVCSPKP
jgi:hypothetical protein